MVIMNSLLYYQYLSNLTENEKIEIDKGVKKNREEVYFFVDFELTLKYP